MSILSSFESDGPFVALAGSEAASPLSFFPAPLSLVSLSPALLASSFGGSTLGFGFVKIGLQVLSKSCNVDISCKIWNGPYNAPMKYAVWHLLYCMYVMTLSLAPVTHGLLWLDLIGADCRVVTGRLRVAAVQVLVVPVALFLQALCHFVNLRLLDVIVLLILKQQHQTACSGHESQACVGLTGQSRVDVELKTDYYTWCFSLNDIFEPKWAQKTLCRLTKCQAHWRLTPAV